MSDKTVSAEMVRRVLAGASLCVPVLVVIISWWVWRDSLPAELASHWSGAGPELVKADETSGSLGG
ncbi:hypothetical protein [Cryobacterium sp. Y62]|uniref:hypothetical protein n=1 Tax=Cryobacterium sp. Y62 TaxID=2048284 RepID=UPI000CE2C09F|nr:hypothetical protein [Cryobacterium sp. Y62]